VCVLEVKIYLASSKYLYMYNPVLEILKTHTQYGPLERQPLEKAHNSYFEVPGEIKLYSRQYTADVYPEEKISLE
jgi:hypothetical protein